MKKTLLLAIASLFLFNLQAQTVEDLKATKADKEAARDALQAEIDALATQINEFPGWKLGGVGVIGFNALANNNWYAIGTPNSSNNALGLGWTGFANLDQEKYFWRNLLTLNLSRSSARADKDDATTQVVALTNGLDLSSLFGYKLTDKIAISAEAKWTSSLVEFDDNNTPTEIFDDKYPFALNNPGQATISAGITWTPIPDLVVLIHPLGYQKNWPGELISAAGAKIGASYAREIIRGVSWSSNLSAFIPYGGAGDVTYADAQNRVVNYSTGNLANWEWINGFSTSIWKGVGVTFNLGLKGNKQVADLGRLTTAATPLTLDLSDNPLQSYYTLGLSYTF